MNGISLTQIQKEALDYVFPYVGQRWSVNGKSIAEMRREWMPGDDPLPTTWTQPKIENCALILSDFQEVNDALYNYVLSYAKMRSSCNELTGYRKRKIRKECKELAHKIAVFKYL